MVIILKNFNSFEIMEAFNKFKGISEKIKENVAKLQGGADQK